MSSKIKESSCDFFFLQYMPCFDYFLPKERSDCRIDCLHDNPRQLNHKFTWKHIESATMYAECESLIKVSMVMTFVDAQVYTCRAPVSSSKLCIQAEIFINLRNTSIQVSV